MRFSTVRFSSVLFGKAFSMGCSIMLKLHLGAKAPSGRVMSLYRPVRCWCGSVLSGSVSAYTSPNGLFDILPFIKSASLTAQLSAPLI